MHLSITQTWLMLGASLILTACGGSESKPNSSAGTDKSNTTDVVSNTPQQPVDLDIINDLSLRECVKQTGIVATAQLQILECTDSSIQSLRGLEQFTNLTVLNLSNNHIADLSPLIPLHSLTSLTVSHNNVNTLDALSALPRLKSLSVAHNQLTDIATISNMANLQKLYAEHNQIADLTPVANTRLKAFIAHHNPAPLPDTLPDSVQSFRI